jgi:hypothetical protein
MIATKTLRLSLPADSDPIAKSSAIIRSRTVISARRQRLTVTANREFCSSPPEQSRHRLLLRAAADRKQKSGLARAEAVRWFDIREA